MTASKFPKPVAPERQPMGLTPELVLHGIPDDDRVWVPIYPDAWIRPLLLNKTHGYWTSLLKVRASGVVSCHRHPASVHGLVMKGSWRYLEHDWVAREGDYVFEPPGETHTLVVDENCEEMITWFLVNGAMIYMNEYGEQVGFTDVFDRIDLCRKHYIQVGLGADYVDRFIR